MIFFKSSVLISLLLALGLSPELGSAGRIPIRRSLDIARALAQDARVATDNARGYVSQARKMARSVSGCVNGQSDHELCVPFKVGFDAVKSVAGDATVCLMGGGESAGGGTTTTTINGVKLDGLNTASCERLNQRLRKVRGGFNTATKIAKSTTSKLVEQGIVTANKMASASNAGGGIYARDQSSENTTTTGLKYQSNPPLPSVPDYLLSYVANFLTTTVLAWVINMYMQFINSSKSIPGPPPPPANV